MPQYRTTVFSKWETPAAFSYMADFSHAAQWDPSVSSAVQLSSGQVGLGTKFDLRVRFNGRSLLLTYEVTAFDPPRRVVLRAETNLVESIDEITFAPTAQGTDVHYNATLRPRGWLRLASPLVAVVFKGLGDRAHGGLARELNR